MYIKKIKATQRENFEINHGNLHENYEHRKRDEKNVEFRAQ